jgi:FkbM family methyltransferase
VNDRLDTALRLAPITLVDIGARGGLDARWRRFTDYLRVVGFEADPAECARLATKPDGVAYLPYAIGERDGEVAPFYVTRNPQCSSFLRPNRAFTHSFAYGPALDVMSETSMTLTSLATVCAREALIPDAVKLDVQGLELAVLRGAGRLLDGVLLIESEVEFNPQYENQPLFGEVDAYVRSHGFYLVGLRRAIWRRRHPDLGGTSSSGGTLMHGDAVWAREPAHLTTERDLLALCVLLAAYDQADTIAWILLGDHPALAAWSPAGRRALIRELAPSRRSRFGWLLGQWHHRQLRAWVDRQRPDGATDWHDPALY